MVCWHPDSFVPEVEICRPAACPSARTKWMSRLESNSILKTLSRCHTCMRRSIQSSTRLAMAPCASSMLRRWQTATCRLSVHIRGGRCCRQTDVDQ